MLVAKEGKGVKKHEGTKQGPSYAHVAARSKLRAEDGLDGLRLQNMGILHWVMRRSVQYTCWHLRFYYGNVFASKQIDWPSGHRCVYWYMFIDHHRWPLSGVA